MSKRHLYDLRRDLPSRLKCALVILLEDGEAIKQTSYWAGSSGRKVNLSTIVALYDRYLIKIVTESRHRKRQTARLTDVGDYAAKEIQREIAEQERIEDGRISEEAQRLIVEAIG